MQAACTELFDDEAYYWVCSRFLDWGYFDHPPMIALLIRVGTFIFPSELGVRIFSVILCTASIYLLERLAEPENKKLFYAIILNILMLQIGGIVAAPDIPLFFFTVLFFISYKQFLEKAGFIQIISLSVIIALMIYSKYHGILVVIFSLFSNFKLLSKPGIYLVAILASLLLIPHFIWQIQYDFPSLQYQLFERLSPPYRISFTSDFIVGQVLIAGPFVGWLIIYASFKYKITKTFEKAMVYSIIGFYILFFFSSFYTRTELNWTIPIIAPLVYLSYHYLKNEEKISIWVYRLLPLSIIISMAIRVFMVLDIMPIKLIPKDEFHQNKSWVTEIKKKAGDLPVVFTNSYQRASKYWFYSGDTSFSLNTYKYRRSGYNFWPLEKKLQQKTVLLIGSESAEYMTQYINTPKANHAMIKIDSFCSYSQLNITSSTLVMEKNNSVKCNLKINYPSDFNKEAYNRDLRIVMILYPTDKSKPLLFNTNFLIDSKNDEIHGVLTLPKLNDREYLVRWGISNSFPEPTINSRVYKLTNPNATQ